MSEKSPERWERVRALFDQAVDLPGDARVAFLETTTSSDPELRAELDRLLAAHDDAGSFLASLDPAMSAALLADTAEPELAMDTVGRYRIVRRLGGGAMGVVYLAYDPELDRPIAVKLLRPRRGPGQARLRVLEEARAASALDHPNIAMIHEVGQTDEGRAFIAMTYCEGASLAEILARGALPAETAANHGRQLASALASAHSLGIVHCDVKPANIMVSTDGRVRLTDFGVARVAGRDASLDGTVAGTPAYMSPDQRTGGEPDPRWDIWALGTVLHEMLTGHRPRIDPTGGVAWGATGESPATAAGPPVPAALGRLIDRCLALDTRDRPAASEVASELDAFLDAKARASRSRWRTGLTAAAAVVAAVVVVITSRTESPSSPPAADAPVIVLPFTSATGDSALRRLGRDLAVTLGASLDGAAGLRVVAPVTVLGQLRDEPAGSDDGELVRRLGAAWRLSGQLTRDGAGVRIDAAVYGTSGDLPVARAIARGPAEDISALTDSLTLALLRSRWGRRTGAVPDHAPITTRSVSALRAYLDGEIAIAAANFRPAALHFARAIEEDSTFWFAWWRYLYARSYHDDPVDSTIISTVREHRASFPEPDRLLVEARMAASQREKLALRKTITERYPTYWPAWFEYADQLVHHGPFLGVSLDEARAALHRVATLQPAFGPAVEHLFWTAILLRDTLESRYALGRLTLLHFDTLAGNRTDLQTMDYYRYLDHLSRTGGEPDEAMALIGTKVLAEYSGSMEPEALATSLAVYGFHRAQIDLAERVAARRPSSRTAAAQLWASAISWAGRGAWDDALDAARQYARTTTHPRGAFWAYGLIASGVWLGEIDSSVLPDLRAAAARAPFASTADGSAELHWLDGIVACARADSATLRQQLAALRSSTAAGATELALSLDALRSAHAGRTGEAARALALLERTNADRSWQFRHGAEHPFVQAINRLAGARLLVASGDTAAAAELLLFHQVDLPRSLSPLPVVTMVLGTHGLPDLARMEAARGRDDLASRYRTLHDERADLATPPRATPRCLAPAGT